MSLPTLNQLLFKNHPPLPTPTKTIKHYMDNRALNSTSGAQVDPNSIASRMAELLKGHKWWLVPELAELLQTSVGTVHSALARHQRKLNIESNRFYNGKSMAKEFRIKPDGI